MFSPSFVDFSILVNESNDIKLKIIASLLIDSDKSMLTLQSRYVNTIRAILIIYLFYQII